MTQLHSSHPAPGRPGIAPKWTRSDKDGVGTAYSPSSPVWWAVSAGVLDEVYYPTIDRPQVRDLQLMITDGRTFAHDERRNTRSTTERLCGESLGYRIVNEDHDGRYRIEKQVISAPHAACVLTRVHFQPAAEWRGKLKLYVLMAPHLAGGGSGNTAQEAEFSGQKLLVANCGEDWLALGATRPFDGTSCGFVGESDGWQDLMDNDQLDWQYDIAADGNVAVIAEIPLEADGDTDFTIGLAFSTHVHGAATALLQSLAVPFAAHQQRFQEQWTRACRHLTDLSEQSGDEGALFRFSHSLLLAHEDKTYQGAMIASLSIPWGESKGDDDLGGYHLVWTRDMVNSALGLMACGNTETPFRALIYLACSQNEDGGFPQNFWIDGEPYWTGIQLDEVAFPILLAWRLHEGGHLRDFDPWPMVRAAAGYLVRHGPVTPQERWEENCGFSPSTLAANIAALTCAAAFAKDRGDDGLATLFQDSADFLNSHVEGWTVTTQGTLLEGVARHFVRIKPASPDEPQPCEDPNSGTLSLRNRKPGEQSDFPAKDIVDAGFLELVRYGLRPADDPLIADSLKVVDACLKVETPFGPVWRRYNHDGYGQRDDGGPFDGWGVGRAWPLLTGERAHYELANGRDVHTLVKAIEQFTNGTGLLPEQVWDEADRPEIHMSLGRPTGSAMPLMWAHSEYVKLLRSLKDGQVYDRIPVVADRYLSGRSRTDLEFWKFNRQVGLIAADATLRVLADTPFRLRFSTDRWDFTQDLDSSVTSIGISYADISPGEDDVTFTFYWTEADRWEGRNFTVSRR